MTLRDSSVRNVTRKSDRSFGGRLRDKRRRKDRRLLSESLEQRQLLAGPDLIGIQPNEGTLLNDGTVLSVSPRELVFRFGDDSNIDPATLSSIRITRAGEGGVFESATALSDLGTDGELLLEFRAAQSGSAGNGIQVEFTSSSRPVSGLPIISVTDKTVRIDVNNNPLRATRVQDLITAVAASAEASSLIEVIQVSGSSLGEVGTRVPSGLSLTLMGANAAEAVTDFGTNGDVRVRFVSQLPGEDGLGTRIQLERRNFGGPANPVIVVTGETIRIQLNSAPGFQTTAQQLIDSINSNPGASALVVTALQEGNPDSPIGASLSLPPLLTLTGVTDVAIQPGYVGLGDTAREVVFRFSEPLPDDLYQIDIIGSGSGALRNTAGESFQDGVDLSRQFNINLGPAVVAVVPEPVRRNSAGELRPEVGKIEVHFNDDDLDLSLAETPAFYQLIFTRDTVRNTDDAIVTPISVDYNNATNIATLDFGRPLSRLNDPAAVGQFLTGAARLRVGASEGLPAPPTDVSLDLDPANPIEPGDSFDSAFDLNTQWTIGTDSTQSARLSSEIFNATPFGLELPGPDLPGTRDIRAEDPSRLLRTVPLDYVRNGADAVDGISVIQYDFAPSWLGDDPNQTGINEDKTYFNIISEQQKERVREVMQLFSEYLGISFVEVEGEPTSAAFMSIAVGDLYGGDERATSGDGGLAVVTRDRNGDGIDDLGVMDFQDFDESTDDQFGGEFFRGAMFTVGQLLGYGYADDLPQPVSQSSSFIFAPGADNEPAFPSVADIVHGQYLYRPDSTDIDLYRFTLGARGTLSVETIAERLDDPSLLDSALRLYRLDNDGAFVEIAQNGDYFSNDSFLELEVDAGTYVIGVSARGNTSYDPNIVDSGFGGLTEGEYELIIDFRPSSTSGLIDSTGVPLDGDGDGRPGGVFDFWFVPNDVNNTLYVDKASTISSGTLGTVSNPYREIDLALAAARPGDTIRVVGNGGVDGLVETPEDNFSYQIGFASNGLPLEDGSSLNLPQGVRMIIDSAAILKLSRTRIGVGSVAPLVDLSDSSLLVLGTPSIIGVNGSPARDSSNAIIPGSVFFTSYNDDTLGAGNSSAFTPAAVPGDWGGIDFRGDLDTADELRTNREDEGIFLNLIQYADFRYGGGAVSIDGRQVAVSPIDMAVTRPTIINSTITLTANAAIAATPGTFEESRFTDPQYQASGAFTPDYTRAGPEIHGNTIVDNSINGLFIRVSTRTGDVLETIDTSARFDDTDIPHVLTENLVISGTAGGPILVSSAPSTLLVRFNTTLGGNVPAGTYMYRLTNVGNTGIESAASQPTIPVTLATTGGVVLSQLSTVDAGSGFTARRLYRATVDTITGLPGDFQLVAQLNGSSTTFVDVEAVGTTVLQGGATRLQSRLDASLKIDPGTVLKIDGARIEARNGANLIAEGVPGVPVVFTSLEDQRYGGGGTFDTNDRKGNGELAPGDWGGIYVGPASAASISNAVIAGAGGATRIEGGFASFNPIEVQQGTLRLANSRLESNADGVGVDGGDRVGRGANAPGTIFVRASAPTIVENQFFDGLGAAITIDVNSLSRQEKNDPGRATGVIDRLDVVGNFGPLVRGNQLENNSINGLQVRGGELATGGVWDDVDIVHVVTDTIEIPNQHIFGGLQLESSGDASLVVKFLDGDEPATIVAGGTVLSATDEFVDISDRIGGAIQVLGTPDFPVVLTSLNDCEVGAGFTPDGQPQLDTINSNACQAVGGLEPYADVIVVMDESGSMFFTQVFTAQLIQDLDDALLAAGIGSGSSGANRYGAVGFGSATDQAGRIVPIGPNGTQFGTAAEYAFAATNNYRIDGFTEDGYAGVDFLLQNYSTRDDAAKIIIFASDEDRDIVDTTLSLQGTIANLQNEGFRFQGILGVGISDNNGQPAVAIDSENVYTIAGNTFNTSPGGSITFGFGTTIADYVPIVDATGGVTGDISVIANSTNATNVFSSILVTSIVGQISSSGNPAVAGDWEGVTVRESASDRNVGAVAAGERASDAPISRNEIPSQSTFLGELAPDLVSGDENRRLGFIVDGVISERSDIDVYSFVAESGTEVWLDIDRTSNSLDTVIELINANGDVLALSNDSILAKSGLAEEPRVNLAFPGINPDAAQPLSVLSQTSKQDTYSTNAKDAGMRIRLPGEVGTRNLYHVRVRSSNVVDAQAADAYTNLIDPAQIRSGLSLGSYELQVRLQEADEIGGTQFDLGEVRYANTGLKIIGQPLRSPLLGEEQEVDGPNDSLQDAQPLGYSGVGDDLNLTEAGPLQSDKLAKAFSGTIDSATDVDWYQFQVNYENLTRDEAGLFLSTAFDLDYASGFARADMALYVFNAQGQLILVGGDSNIADDLPGSATSNDTDDLSRGSAGTADPYIGAAELSEGTYFVAVANQQQVPLPLDQFFNANSANPLLRLEPIDSVTRIAEDRIGFGGGGTGSDPTVPLLFDADSIVDFSFDDTLLYVNTATRLLLVNPFTGAVYGNVGDLSEPVRDVAFRANGELFGYTENGPITADNATDYVRIDTASSAFTTISTGANIETFHLNNFAPTNLLLDADSDDGIQVEAIAIGEFLGTEEGYFVANRPVPRPGLEYFTNILYDFDDETGLATGPTYDRNRFVAGAGTTRREVGQINTDPNPGTFSNQLGISDATVVDRNGIATPAIRDGDTFTLSNVTDTVTFEFEQGYTLFADGSQPVRDGDSVTIDSVVFEFNTNSRLQLSEVVPVGSLNEGSTVSVEGADGIVTFEFVRFGSAAPGNIEILLVDAQGIPLSANQITQVFAASIDANVNGVTAQAVGNEVLFGDSPLSLSTTGAGVAILGDPGLNDPNAIEVRVSETIDRVSLIETLAAAIRTAGIPVSNVGTQLSLPTATSLLVQPDPSAFASAFSIIGTPGVTSGNIAILLLPTDTAATIGQRISLAVQEANDNGDLPNVTAIPNGHSVTIAGGFIVNASRNLVVGGRPTGGSVTGIELVNNQLYAITDTGGLFVVNTGELASNGNREVGRYLATATDLVGINFTGLRAGPVSVESGSLSQILFGVTGSGDIYAFNTRGELQPVFAGGRSVISTGVFGALGLDFSVVDFNLWHATSQRFDDPGHGVDALDNSTRIASDGGSSLAFTYENSVFRGNYPSLVEQPTFAPRLDGTSFEDSFNLPGGAKGVVQSNEFDLEGYSANDLPTLYFNYFADNDGNDDRLRVYVVTELGVEHLVASNTVIRFAGSPDDEFDDPTTGVYEDDIDIDVQQLFDNTGTWRQARVSLNDFAGQSGLSLRIEFSTGGTALSSSESIRMINGQAIAASGDREFTIQGGSIAVGTETFVLDLAPTVSFPSGAELAALYVDPNQTAVIRIDSQDYLLNDGTRVVLPGQIEIDLLAGLPVGATLEDLSSNDIANSVSSGIQNALPANNVAPGVNFSDPTDDPNIVIGRNDLIYEATALPYSGGNLTITGAGRFGSFAGPGQPITNLDDVDLLRLEVREGALIAVDVDLDFNPSLSAAIRFFDARGNELPGVPDPTSDTIQYTATQDGVIFIGLSGLGNENYDPRIPGSGQNGQIDSYTASVSVTLSSAYRVDGNLIEFNGGQQSITVSQPSLFTISQTPSGSAYAVPVSRFMSSGEVATEVQRAIANRFFEGNAGYVPLTGSTVRLAALNIGDAGPFVSESDRYGDQYASTVFNQDVPATQNNTGEGIYLDDFIIGFAERGEIATGSNVVSTPFVTDLRPQFPLPADPTSSLLTGSYQVEIRDASEYVSSIDSTQFRTLDTNARLTGSLSVIAQGADQVRDGQTFEIYDGRSTVVFEFDSVELNDGVTPGNVAVPFSLKFEVPGTEDLDPITGLPIPGTGMIRANTASEIAANVIEAINRNDVRSIIDVAALPGSGIDATVDATINVFGEVAINDADGAFSAIDVEDRRGDDNRDRDSQGVVLIQNSRFLFNAEYGIDISQDLTATVAGNNTTSVVRYPRNLVELNSESIKPGVVVRSNVLAYNALGGIQIAGIDPTLNETFSDPISFERIVNNTIVGGTVSRGVASRPDTFEGILFDQGGASFADLVVDYDPRAGGSPPASEHRTATNALGIPDAGGRGVEPVDGLTTVSLGLGGTLTVQFTNNLLSGSGDSRPDLAVFETGEIESVLVEVSRNGTDFFDVGIIGGLTSQLDIDAAGFGREERFAFVRLTDLRQGSTDIPSLGADIDAIGALSSVPVERFTSGGTGINITGNAAPVLLNNVISNSELGVELDPANSLLVLGGNSFYRNDTNITAGASLGQFAQDISDSQVIFADPVSLVFAPAAGAAIIDSSIDSLEDRESLTAVKAPLGLRTSPILAPDFDVNGQLRVDDPNVESPGGIGESVFKDRGASDRGDQVGPRVLLLSPSAPNLGLDSGMVTVAGVPPLFFEVQLIDGIAPADIVPGTGIDDTSISSQSVLLLKDNVALIEGVDYRFSYHPTTNVIRLTPVAGVWETNSTYVIRMIDASDAIVQATDGESYVDAGVLRVRDSLGETTSFEYETGITIEFDNLPPSSGVFDGVELELFDGTQRVIFELDDDQNFDAANVVIPVPETFEELIADIAQAINDSGLNFSIGLVNEIVQLHGNNPLATATTNSRLVDIQGAIGTATGFGIGIPNDDAAVADTVEDGQTFVVRQGAAVEVTFELDTNGSVTAGNTPVSFASGASLDAVADAIVRAVGGAGLGLDPSNAGFGRVSLGGDGNYSVDLTDSTLVQLGFPGEEANVPIVIDVTATAEEVAATIAATIDSVSIPGITTSVVDTRVFLEGTGGVSGEGAVDTISVRDEVGNLLQSNQENGRTELSIFIGGGFDYGDAPSPYLSTTSQGGPRHAVDQTFALAPVGSSRPLTADNDAKLPNADDDNGVSQIGVIQPGFIANFAVDILNEDGRQFYVDAWFDWDADGNFEVDEVLRFGSAGTGLPTLAVGGNVIVVPVPSDAATGEIYARFRLSEQVNLGSTGDATSGEVEDYRFVVNNNPFQNPVLTHDVNDSGAVTPLDALQIINAIGRNDGNDIFLDVLPLPVNLPPFPDVTGDSVVSALDALRVINELARTPNSSGGSGELVGEGEATSYVPLSGGLLASGATALGDALIAEAREANESQLQDQVSTLNATATKTSVFDNAAVVDIDSIVDSLAEDTATARGEEETDTLDQLFATL